MIILVTKGYSFKIPISGKWDIGIFGCTALINIREIKDRDCQLCALTEFSHWAYTHTQMVSMQLLHPL